MAVLYRTHCCGYRSINAQVSVGVSVGGEKRRASWGAWHRMEAKLFAVESFSILYLIMNQLTQRRTREPNILSLFYVEDYRKTGALLSMLRLGLIENSFSVSPSRPLS